MTALWPSPSADPQPRPGEVFVALLLLASALALGAEHVRNIGPEVTYDQGGAWARVLPADDTDWHFFFGAGGEFYRLDMTEDLVISEQRQAITGRSDLDDHAITTCPTGGAMLASSAGVTRDNDSGWIYRLDDSFQPVTTTVVAESDPEVVYNDMALICGDDGGLVTYNNFLADELVLVRLEDSGAVRTTTTLAGMPTGTGASLLADPETGEVLLIGVEGRDQLRVARLSWDLELLSLDTVYQVDDRDKTFIYWPQAALPVGDRFLVAWIQQEADEGFNQDWGHVHLAVFDRAWTLLEAHQITDAAPPDGAMRPGLAVRDDTLIVSYDRIVGSPGLVQPRLRAVTLNLGAFEDPDTGGTDTGISGSGTDTATGDSGPTGETGDSATADSGPPADSGPGDPGEADARCAGCGGDDDSPPPPGAALLLLGLWGSRRRAQV